MVEYAGRKQPGPNGAKTELQRGFTLIEMSIVLAIIGLIVGGILKGQEVVNNARVRAQASQIDKLRGALFTFQDAYTFLPGDYAGSTTLGTSTACDGKGTGVVNDGTTSAMTDGATESAGTESYCAFVQLTAANQLAGVQIGTAVTTTGIKTGSTVGAATIGLYPAKLTNDFVIFATFSSQGVTAPMARLQQSLTTAALTTTNYGISGSNAYQVDKKYDDGVPSSGSILAGSTSSLTACQAASTGATQYISATNTTAGGPALTGTACVLLWEMN
jgi:prepilin-type N-terminal cleavage/methylation domain-containing protein